VLFATTLPFAVVMLVTMVGKTAAKKITTISISIRYFGFNFPFDAILSFHLLLNACRPISMFPLAVFFPPLTYFRLHRTRDDPSLAMWEPAEADEKIYDDEEAEEPGPVAPRMLDGRDVVIVRVEHPEVFLREIVEFDL